MAQEGDPLDLATEASGLLVRALVALMGTKAHEGDDYTAWAIGGKVASGELFDGEFVWGNGWCGLKVALRQESA